MNSFNIHKRKVRTFEAFLKDAEKSEKAKHIVKGEAEIVKNAMPGEENPKDGVNTMDGKPKTIKGEHAVVKKTFSGEDNGKEGRAVLDKPITESLSEDTDRMHNALIEADEAFWAVIVKHYPEIKTGDFAPDATHAWDEAKKKALKIWLDSNEGVKQDENLHESFKPIKTIEDKENERKFEFFKTPSGKIEYKVYDWDTVAGEWNNDTTASADMEWLFAEENPEINAFLATQGIKEK